MSRTLLSAEDFRMAAKDGAEPDGMVFRFTSAEPETIGETDARVKRFVFSDETVDRAGDVIKQDGWDLKDFKRNPVALFSHMSWEPPIGRASNVKVQNGQLVGDIEFAPPEAYPFADTIYRLVDGGYLKAVSVGFMPKEWSFTSDKNRPYGIDYRKQALGEISVCALPCNPNALEVARSAGIDTAPLIEWAEKVLDTGDTVFLPRKELEGLRSQAGAPEKRYYIQVPKGAPINAEAAERIREHVKRWQSDPTDVLILTDGLTLRTVGDEPVVHQGEPRDADLPTDIEPQSEVDGNVQVKAGRKVSAATKVKLKAALDHHDAAMARHGEAAKCIKDLMDGDMPDDEPDEDDTEDKTLDPVPPADVVEEDANLTPEERRLKEARAIKVSLPQND